MAAGISIAVVAHLPAWRGTAPDRLSDALEPFEEEKLMPDRRSSTPGPSDNKEAAQQGQGASIADEAAAYEIAVEKDAPSSIDEGDPATKNDGSGTSETD